MKGKISRVDPDWLRRKILEEGLSYTDVGKILGISRERVRQYCEKYGITLDQRKACWYARRSHIPELETPKWLLEKKKEGRGLKSLAKELGIGVWRLKNQIRRLGLDPKDFRRKAKTLTMPCAWCGKPVTRKAHFVERQGYKHFFCDRACLGKWLATNYGLGKGWSIEEEEFVKKNWQRMSDREMAKYLSRSEMAIKEKRYALGLKRRPTP